MFCLLSTASRPFAVHNLTIEISSTSKSPRTLQKSPRTLQAIICAFASHERRYRFKAHVLAHFKMCRDVVSRPKLCRSLACRLQQSSPAIALKKRGVINIILRRSQSTASKSFSFNFTQSLLRSWLHCFRLLHLNIFWLTNHIIYVCSGSSSKKFECANRFSTLSKLNFFYWVFKWSVTNIA